MPAHAAPTLASVPDRRAGPPAPPERRFRLHRPWFLPEGRGLQPEVWQQRHRGLTLLLWAHVPGLFIFGLLRGYSVLSTLLQVGVLAVPALLAMWSRLGRNARSASTSIGLVIGASVMVHLSGGSIEAHFQFFVVLTFLTLYQTWLPFLLALVYVVLEHGLIGTIDPKAVYNNAADIAHPWKFAIIHGGFVLAASLGNLLSWRLTEQEALHDGLTSLPNRSFLLSAMDKRLGTADHRPTAVLYIDLDNFKDANDAFGHQVGDELLIALARRLEHQMRRSDIIARLGGDEFAVYLPEVMDKSDAFTAAQRVLTALEQPVSIGSITLRAYGSVGVAFSEPGMSAADLLRNADLAMYEAKRDGGGQVVEYKQHLHTAALRRTELEAELREAMEAGQFVLHYQPIVDLTSHRIVGTEALIRWDHPTRGLLAPGEFITAAELSGLIVPLGAWVIREACQQTARWHEQRPDAAPLSIAVNLSPRQLIDRTLVATVAEALHYSGLDPANLCLEITEGSVIKDYEASMPTLNALRALGVSLALDDFGTGYSSLSYLRELPVSTVKIDRSFVKDLDADNAKSEIVLAIIELSHALGLTVTAEGAETVDQLTALTAMRSDRAQGYLLGRPMPSGQMDEALADGQVPLGELASASAHRQRSRRTSDAIAR